MLMLSPGCSIFKKHPKVSLPSHPLVLPKPKPHPPLPDLDAPPALEPDPPDTQEVAVIHIPTPEIPPRPAVPRPRRQRHDVTPKDEQGEPADSEETEQPADEAPPQLVQLLTAEQRRQYDQLIDQDLNQAQKSLVSVAGRNLTPEETRVSQPDQSIYPPGQRGPRTGSYAGPEPGGKSFSD